eukprot:366281-Chlamydomonas_euryale.AAC.9
MLRQLTARRPHVLSTAASTGRMRCKCHTFWLKRESTALCRCGQRASAASGLPDGQDRAACCVRLNLPATGSSIQPSTQTRSTQRPSRQRPSMPSWSATPSPST